MIIEARNVTHALSEGLWWLKVAGKRENTRNGKVIVSPDPVMTCYTRPWERVIFYPERDANPFFHLFEAIWMLAGSSDANWIGQFNKQMLQYADKGYLHGAYGHRWRAHFLVDQIEEVIKLLKHDPQTRRAVIGMWDPEVDLGASYKDLPCNTHIYFRVRGKALEMTVCCRSNDIVWGSYGANAVHFSVLHELIARGCGLKQGLYYQFSNNYHIYKRHWGMLDVPYTPEGSAYPRGIPLLTGKETWRQFLDDCEEFVVYGATKDLQTKFMKTVAIPMLRVWKERKMGDMVNCDWKVAATEWLTKRSGKHESR